VQDIGTTSEGVRDRLERIMSTYEEMDRRFMAAEVHTQPSFRRGRVRALFDSHLEDLWQDTRNHYDVTPKGGIDSFRKIVAGKQLWNYDNLEPTEKKLVL